MLAQFVVALTIISTKKILTTFAVIFESDTSVSFTSSPAHLTFAGIVASIARAEWP